MNSNLFSNSAKQIKEEKMHINKLDCLVNDVNLVSPSEGEI